MIKYSGLKLLFLVSSMTSQVIEMMPPKPPQRESSRPFQVEGITQRIEELPKELRYKASSPAREAQKELKYIIYSKLKAGSPVTAIALNENNKLALTGSLDNIARLWNVELDNIAHRDVENEKLLKEFKHEYSKNDFISSVALSADGSIALTGSTGGTAGVWDTNTGEPLHIFQIAPSDVSSVALSADGSIALIGSYEFARLYNTSTGALLKELKGHTSGISSVALSADGKIALTGSFDRTVQVWKTLTGDVINTLRVGFPVTSVALSADGATAVTGSNDDRALVWDVNSGVLLNRLLTDGPAARVALSKDGKRLATSNGWTIKVWNTQPLPGVNQTSIPLTVLKGHTRFIVSLAFGGSDFIASGSDDNTALIWKPASF